MAGRHGNKGVVCQNRSRRRQCPTCPIGTPVEIVLNPRGRSFPYERRPILERHLGWASKEPQSVARSVQKLLDRDVPRANRCASGLKEVFGDTGITEKYVQQIRRRNAGACRRNFPRRNSIRHAGI